jgi:hypothetical protein
MSRRTGKAATRRARQQKRTKQGPSPAATAPAPAPNVPAADATTPTTSSATTAAAPRPAVPAYASGSSSRLGESARLEYHYVGRDLRNTAILTLVMGALLVAAVVAVNLISAAS